MKLIIATLLLVYGAMAAYNVKMAQSLAYACACNYGTQAEINSWTCKYCPYYNLTNTKAFNNSISDIFGFTGYSPKDDAIIVSFRSTVSIQNWIVNLDATEVPFPGCAGCLVHQGFYNAFSGVQGFVRTEIQKLTALYRSAKIFVTGYSLGGALATIAAADIQAIFGHVDQLYTYGQPRVGNEAFANYVTAHVTERYRVIHYNDIVPHVPPQIPIPYSHFASEIWYDKAMKTYKQCGAQEFKCSKSVLPTNWNTDDHSINFYIAIQG